MSDKSAIEWCDATWNPVRGCTKISQGCKHCYAEIFAERFRGVPGHAYEQGFDLRLAPEMLDQPRRWKRARRIFVNSMSDIFHKDVPLEYILRIFQVMAETPRHTYLLLTKRADRMASLAPALPWPPNVWMGVSVESMDVAARVDHLRAVPAAVRFLSCEPLLGSLAKLDLAGVDWVIAGGESGHHARPMHDGWVIELRDRAVAAGIPFFFKQWGQWKPYSEMTEEEGDALYYPQTEEERGREMQRRCRVGWTFIWPDGRLGLSGTGSPTQAFKVGKGQAGRQLRGRTWDEFPKPPALEASHV